MFANLSVGGEGVSLADRGGVVLEDDDAIQRYRDLLMLRHRALGLTYRQIGKILGMGHGTVHRRVAAIPDAIKELHGANPLA